MDNERMKATVHELGDKIQDASGAATDYAKSQAKKLSASAEGASALAGDAYDRGGRYLRDANRAVGGQIGDNTLTALLLAGAAGYLLSYIVHSGR
jgi:hypothetical protein